MVLVYHKVFKVPGCQDSALTAGCIVDSTGIHYLIPPGLVEDGCSGQLRLVRERQRERLYQSTLILNIQQSFDTQCLAISTE